MKPIAALLFDAWGAPDAPVALLLHGVGGSRLAWGDEVSGTGRALSQAGWRAVAVDLPGYGRSALIDPYDMAALAASVLATLDQLGDKRALLVGHSMGGMVAQEVAAVAPERVSGLVLSGTSPAFGKPGGDWQQKFLHERLAPLDAGQGMAALAPALARGMASALAPPEAVARCVEVMAQVSEATYRAALQAIVGFDRRADLARLTVPVLLLAGEHDRNAPPAVMQAMAQRIADAEFVLLPGVGHLAQMEAPEPVHRALLSFLARRFPTADHHGSSVDVRQPN